MYNRHHFQSTASRYINIHSQAVTIVWKSATTRAPSPQLSPAEILEHEVRKIRNINES
jgi:hypothetical protein